MKRWKRFSTLLLCILLVLGLAAGCGGTGSVTETAGEEISLTVQDNNSGGGEAAEAEDPPEEEEEKALLPDGQAQDGPEEAAPETPDTIIDRNGSYTSKEDVALYLHTYGELPSNFITKKEARKLGWDGGSLEPYAPGMCIGGDHFGNYEGVLPDGDYRECDIDTLGASRRGAKRIIYAEDGRIYYTGDHYKSFELLYGEE